MIGRDSKQTLLPDQCFSELRINVVSDLHYCSDSTVEPWMPGGAYDAQERLEHTLNTAAMQQADVTLWLGDIVDRGHVASYNAFDKAVNRASLAGDFFITPGNHDRRKALHDSIRNDRPTECCEDQGRFHCSVTRGKHILFVLDSAPLVEFGTGCAKGSQYAEIGPVGRAWLHCQLGSINKHSTAWIFTHYPAHKFDVPWIATSAIMRDGPQLHEILLVHKEKIGAVFSGHLHHRFSKKLDEIDYHSLMPASVPLTVAASDSGSSVIRDPEGHAGLENLVLRGRNDCSITPQY